MTQTQKKSNPVDPDYYLGTVTFIDPTHVHLNLPFAAAKSGKRDAVKGTVGDYVFIDCEQVRVLGRIIDVSIPEKERLSIEPKFTEEPNPHPRGRIQILASLKRGSDKLDRGVNFFPRVGDSVYLANSNLLSQIIQASIVDAASKPNKKITTLPIGKIGNFAQSLEISFTPEKLFGRHCGIFGATGGGKSYTVAKLLQEIKNCGGKAILFDPTGEYCELGLGDIELSLSPFSNYLSNAFIPFSMGITDALLTIFNPAPQVQKPKLLEAIKSLKLAQIIGDYNKNNSSQIVTDAIDKIKKTNSGYSFSNFEIKDGLISKELSDKILFNQLSSDFHDKINSIDSEYDVVNIPRQLIFECVHDIDFSVVYGNHKNNPNLFGPTDMTAYGHCSTLISRISSIISSNEIDFLLNKKGENLAESIDSFLKDSTKKLFILSFKHVGFSYNIRAIIVDVIGKYLLKISRQSKFIDKPLILFLDEAHQFLDKTIGEDNYQTKLDSFGLIAKEGRKYGLTTVIATQRPRDIPEDVLSQLGVLIVHRLTNEHDRRAVEYACGDLDRDAAKFIPMLAPGEAMILGSDLPTPLPITIAKPKLKPNSKGPDYQRSWDSKTKI